jgi:hypothetical protein
MKWSLCRIHPPDTILPSAKLRDLRGITVKVAFASVVAVLTMTVIAISMPYRRAIGATAMGAPAVADSTGVHDFDFEVGNWRVHHRLKHIGSSDWTEFEGTSSNRPLMAGTANVEDNTFHRPGGDTHGVALRAFNAKTGQWAIWWVDSRNPHGTLDPPLIGHFEKGVGTFYSDGLLNGKEVRTRFIWSHLTPTSARWEQALSWDGGKSWDTNWIMEFRRTS